MGVITTGTGDTTGGVLTTKGDLATSDGSKIVRLPVGSNDQVLTADSTQTDGVKWATPTVYGPKVPHVIQSKQNGTGAIGSIILGQAPANGNSLILFVNAFNTADPTAVSSTNTTWTKIKNWTGGGGAKYSVWVGVVSGGAGGTTITITHSNSFLTCGVIEVTDALTPTLASSVQTNTLDFGNEMRDSLTGIGAGHLVVIVGGNDNTNAANVSFTDALQGASAGLYVSLASIVVVYAPADGVVEGVSHTAGGNATIAVMEVT